MVLKTFVNNFSIILFRFGVILYQKKENQNLTTKPRIVNKK